MASRKITVTIPEELLREVQADAGERGLSAYVAEALRSQRDRDRLRELSDWLQAEHGPVTDSERSDALDELRRIDAEHERRRGTGRRRGDDAA